MLYLRNLHNFSATMAGPSITHNVQRENEREQT